MSDDADRVGRTALHYAARDGDTARVVRMIAAGADVDAQDRAGDTPLHFAAQECHVETAQALLGSGASVHLTDRFGNTALWRATFHSHGFGELILLLLEHGADPDAVNASGATPRTLADQIGNYDVRQFFVRS